MKKLNEISKATLGSYAKKAAKDATINRKIATDFEHRAKRAKKQDMKDANTSVSNNFKQKSFKRSANVDKAINRLMENTPKKNQDVADKSYLKDLGKKPTVKSDLKNLKNFLTGKKETMESVTEAHKVGDSVTVNSKFFGKQTGKVTKVDGQSIHVQRSGKKTSEKYPHDAVVKEEVEQIEEVSKSEVNHHFNQWSNSEHAPYNSDAGDDKKVHQSAMSYLRSTNVPKEKHEKLAMHIADKFHGSGIDEEKDAREYDYEGDMAKSQLRSIIANAQTVHDILKDDTNMAEWVQSKITLSADYISTVRDYITSETNEETHMEPIHPSALHVKPVKTATGTKYKVHAVGKKFADGIKVGEHLSDSELDDFSEMGGKVKHMKESTLNDILEMARGRPRKNPLPAKKSSEEGEDDYGPDTGPEADQNIHMQLKRAHDARDLKGGADVKFENGKKHFIKSEHAHKVVTALEKLKPADRATAASHIYKSHDNFQAVHSMLK